jgi:Fic family protein
VKRLKDAFQMYEDEIKEYDSLAKEYQSLISDKFSREDFMEYNEILFSAHSCAIEGNSFTVDETRTLKEKGLGMIPQGKPLVEAFEMLDHFSAYEYMTTHLEGPLTEEYLKKVHSIITEHTIAYRHPGAIPGQYTDTDMCAGDTVFGDHKKLIARIPDLLRSTEDALKNGMHPMVVASIFHGYFEYLHPFRDGNGRIGRLLSNRILLQKGLPIVIIKNESRAEYIRCLKCIRTEGTQEYLVEFFFKCAMDRMKEEMAEKKNLTINFKKGFTKGK